MFSEMYNYILISVLALCNFYTEVNGDIKVCLKVKTGENDTEAIYSLLVDRLNEALTAQLDNDPPLFFEHSDFDFKHPAISLKGEVNNVTMSQYNDYNLTYFSLKDVLKGEFEAFSITFRNISFAGEYIMDGNIGDLFDIWGSGHFWANPHNFSISAKAKILSFNLTALCFSANVKVELESFEGWFYNLMDDDELEEVLNHAIAGIIPEVVEVILAEYKEDIDEALEKVIDEILNGNSTVSLGNNEDILQTKEN